MILTTWKMRIISIGSILLATTLASLDTKATIKIIDDTNEPNISNIEHPPHKLPFAYYLQNINYEKLKEINPALVVVDPFDSRLTNAQIKDLRHNHGQMLFAYISAGEVDPTRKDNRDGYRFLPEWKDAEWLTSIPAEVQNNDRWATKRIAYWHEGWHEIMTQRAKYMAKQGYDGVMLDTADTYFAYEELNIRPNVKQDMADLVAVVRDAGQAINPNFKVMTNGGLSLLNTKITGTNEPFLDVVWGQLKEDIWYNEDGLIDEEWTPYDLEYVTKTVESGVPVFSIDYFTDEERKTPNGKHMADYMKKAKQAGVIPFAADRLLGRFIDFNRSHFKDKSHWESANKAGIK